MKTNTDFYWHKYWCQNEQCHDAATELTEKVYDDCVQGLPVYTTEETIMDKKTAMTAALTAGMFMTYKTIKVFKISILESKKMKSNLK